MLTPAELSAACCWTGTSDVTTALGSVTPICQMQQFTYGLVAVEQDTGVEHPGSHQLPLSPALPWQVHECLPARSPGSEVATLTRVGRQCWERGPVSPPAELGPASGRGAILGDSLATSGWQSDERVQQGREAEALWEKHLNTHNKQGRRTGHKAVGERLLEPASFPAAVEACAPLWTPSQEESEVQPTLCLLRLGVSRGTNIRQIIPQSARATGCCPEPCKVQEECVLLELSTGTRSPWWKWRCVCAWPSCQNCRKAGSP